MGEDTAQHKGCRDTDRERNERVRETDRERDTQGGRIKLKRREISAKVEVWFQKLKGLSEVSLS